MRKFYLLFAALFAVSLVANAGIKNLYKQDFELVSTPEDAGWISPNCAGGMSIAGDAFGKYFLFKHSGGGERNAYTIWGTDLYGENTNKYILKFDYSPAKKPDTNLANEVVIFADSTFATNRWANQNYRKTADQIKAGATEPDRWWLFDLTELTDENKEGNTYAVNGDSINFVTLDFGAFYTITLNVDVDARTVEWNIDDEFGSKVEGGVYNVPENVLNLRATGLNLLGGKVGSENIIDNILIQVETAEDYANAPTVALTGINGTGRTYTISFEEASNNEVLHVTFNGTEISPDEVKGDGMYVYNLNTSGKLVAWTESGSAVSEKVEVDVEAVMIALPAVFADIVGVNEGYAKTYQMNVSNKETPTQPQIFFNYKYTTASGDVVSKDNCLNGERLDVTEKGVLEITSHDGGLNAFSSTTVRFENNTKYAVKNDIDFQHMTEDNLKSLGFEEIDVLASTSTSGETNWTGRTDVLRFNWVNDGDTVFNVRPYDVDHGGIRRFVFAPSKLTEEVAHQLFAPMYTWFSATGDGEDIPQMKFNYGIGLIQSGVKGDAQSGSITVSNVTMGVDGLTDSDYIIVNKIDNYGRGATDGTCVEAATEEEAINKYNALNWVDIQEVWRGTETFQLYRIDTALNRLRTFVIVSGDGIEEIAADKVVSDHNAPIFNLNGMQVNANSLQRGIYIKQGKKFIVR